MIPRIRTLAGLAALACLVVLSTGCSSVTQRTAVKPPGGFLYANFRAPLTVDLGGVDLTKARKASASKTQFFHEPFLTHAEIAWGDASIARIAEQGGIRNVAYADYEYMNILGIYSEFTVHVYGE